ncbi:MAG: pilus assembly protein TadG-related protein [Candidatus Sulfopaludibacter sp.]|nr:pilus assembly protein TadG-related protein [Candidatus Sulfopaludibacter sp.]
MKMQRSFLCSCRSTRRSGFVLVTMALTAAGVIAVAGLAVDLGRVFIVKNEIQVYADAAALAGAMALDGTTAGIQNAAIAIAASGNKWNFGTAGISSPSVAFAVASHGPWAANPNPAAGYSFVRITATAPVPLYFLPCLTGQSSFVVTSTAVAGQIPIGSIGNGLAPYSAVSTAAGGPGFGFVAGNSYSIHWPTFNGNRSGCGPGNPGKCFNSAPCADDSAASLLAVVNNWGSSYHGYWGSNSNSAIASAVLNGTQLAPLSIGMNLDPYLTSGNKQSEAGYLDERASQDADTTHNTPGDYMASTSHNGRRLLPVAIVDPVDPSHTNVVGYGVFLLMANGAPSSYYKKSTNGNSPYCALYVGPYNIGNSGPSAGGSTGATTVEVVQ